MNSALKTRHLWGLNPGRHFKCITREIWGRACEIKPTNQPLISYLILFVMIYHIFCAFYCLKYPFKYRQTPLYGHPLNPLSPNIQVQILQSDLHTFPFILGDPGADSGGEGKSKRAEKYGTKKSKEWREEPLGTMSYQTSSKRSPLFWLLIGGRKLVFFS